MASQRSPNINKRSVIEICVLFTFEDSIVAQASLKLRPAQTLRIQGFGERRPYTNQCAAITGSTCPLFIDTSDRRVSCSMLRRIDVFHADLYAGSSFPYRLQCNIDLSNDAAHARLHPRQLYPKTALPSRDSSGIRPYAALLLTAPPQHGSTPMRLYPDAAPPSYNTNLPLYGSTPMSL